MNAVIVGGGKVGSELAATLVNDGHNVTVIELDQKALSQLAEEVDIMPLCGNGNDISVLREAAVERADIFIAVSPFDALNLLSCLMAQQISDVKTIARVRNPMYSKELDFLKQKLGISKIINPEQLASNEIYKLLQYPALSRIDLLENGKVVIFTLHIKPEHEKLVGKDLKHLRQEICHDILVCSVERAGEVLIPSGNFVINTGDDLTFISTLENMQDFFKNCGINNKSVSNVMITGGGTTAYYLIEKMLSHGKDVRVVENDESRCRELSEDFPDADIVYGDGTDKNFLLKHGMDLADSFVALTGVDEENIIASTFAKNLSNTKKVVAKVNRTDLSDVIYALDIDSVVFPKLICADIIAQYVRALNSGVGGNIETLFRYMDNRVEIVEFKAGEAHAICNTPLIDLDLKKNLIIAGIIHDNKFIIPSGKDKILAGDSVIVVSMNQSLTSLKDILK